MSVKKPAEEQLSEQVTDRLVEAFYESDWEVERKPIVERELSRLPDLRVTKFGVTYSVVVAVARDARRGTLEALLARAILVARATTKGGAGEPLAVVGAPLISDAMVRDLEMFADSYADGVAWGVVGGDGFVAMFGPQLETVRRERGRRLERIGIPSRADLFSDLSQWMLKVLVSHRLPHRFEIHPQVVPIATAQALAETASVALPTVNRFIRTLRTEGFCEDGFPLRVMREEELLERWRTASVRTPVEVRARWIFPQADSQRHLMRVVRDHTKLNIGRHCLGLFAACDALGVGFVRGVSPHLYLETISAEQLQKLGLVAAEPGEPADVFIRAPRFPESVFRGAKTVEGVMVSDVIQCWLDVAYHPVRGPEMAEQLYTRVLFPDLVQGKRS